MTLSFTTTYPDISYYKDCKETTYHDYTVNIQESPIKTQIDNAGIHYRRSSGPGRWRYSLYSSYGETKEVMVYMSWKRYEKETCEQHNGRHIGGPGKPDYTRGSVRGEVKHRQTPVTKPELMSLRQKGVTEIILWLDSPNQLSITWKNTT